MQNEQRATALAEQAADLAIYGKWAELKELGLPKAAEDLLIRRSGMLHEISRLEQNEALAWFAAVRMIDDAIS